MTGTRVLMIDGDDRLREVVTGILEEDGIEVVASAVDGDGALSLVEENDPDVVLIDMVLPSGSGLTVADDIRAARPDQPIVLFSAIFDPAIECVAVSHGLVYLEKCDGVEALERAIWTALDGSGARKSLRTDALTGTSR